MVSPVGVKLHHQIDFKLLFFLAPPKTSRLYPQPKNQWPSNHLVTTISGDAQKRPFRTVADLGTAAHTPDVRPTEQSGHVNGHHVARDLIPTVLKGDSPKKTGPFVMICKELAVMVR